MVNDALFMSNRDDWETPDYVFKPIHESLEFTIDAAANKDNAKFSRYWTEEDDALSQDWEGEIVWCNPPYGRKQVAFLEKGPEAKTACFLIPVRPDTKVWHRVIIPSAFMIVFIEGRITFVGAKAPAPFPSCLVIFNQDDRLLQESMIDTNAGPEERPLLRSKKFEKDV